MYTRRTDSFGRLANERKRNQANSFRAASLRYARRMKAEELEKFDEEDNDELSKDLNMTASRVIAIRKAAAMRRAEMEDEEAPFVSSSEIDSNEDPIETPARTKANLGPCKIHIGNEANGGDPSVSNLKNIIARLDRLASYAEECGDKKLAEEIDVITNTIEQEDE